MLTFTGLNFVLLPLCNRLTPLNQFFNPDKKLVFGSVCNLHQFRAINWCEIGKISRIIFQDFTILVSATDRSKLNFNQEFKHHWAEEGLNSGKYVALAMLSFRPAQTLFNEPNCKTSYSWIQYWEEFFMKYSDQLLKS